MTLWTFKTDKQYYAKRESSSHNSINVTQTMVIYFKHALISWKNAIGTPRRFLRLFSEITKMTELLWLENMLLTYTYFYEQTKLQVLFVS